jgi:hypothetical protein
MAGTITVKPGQTLSVVGIPADSTLPPYVPGPVDPGYSPPWAQIPPGGQGGGPVDPGYSPPWAQVPGGGGGSPPNWSPIHPSHPIANPFPPYVDIGGPGPQPPWPTEPPPVKPPEQDSGNWVWAWSPQLNRWVWVKVPGEGEAGPKA